MAGVPAIMSVLDPLEKAVFLASTAKPFAEYDAKELSVELAKALKFIFKDIGYRNGDDSETGYLIVRIVEILKRYYGTLTIKDFRMAFEMTITGQLDDFLPKGRDGQADRGHYQQFNADYVCKILNAYKGRRAWILKKANDARPVPERTVDVEEMQCYRDAMKKDCIAAFEFYKETGRMPEISPIAEMLYYNELADAGLAKEIVVTVDEQKAILARTLNHFSRRGMVGDVRRLQQAGPDAPELQPGAFTLSRRKALHETFAKMKADGITLTDYIKIDNGK